MTTALLGSESPRLSTEPLRKLTKHTTAGYEVIAFAEEVLGMELLPWQKWWLIHALELDKNGDFRFRTILTLVGRQNGKTTLLKILALAFLYLGRARLVLGAAQSLEMAREAWNGSVDLAEGDPYLKREIAAVRRANGEQELRLDNGARYKIAAANRSAGRGLSVDLLILDELREHRDHLAWAALSKTTMARPNSLTVCISNAGDDESTVLNALRGNALSGAEPSLGIFEWSAEDGCAIDDPTAWAAANPGLGHTIAEAAIRSAMTTDPANVFRTEVLCQRVDSLDSAIDLGAWRVSVDPAGSLAREQISLCLDVAPDSLHVTLAGAATMRDGRIRVGIFGDWYSTEEARSELPSLIENIDPVAVAWFPSGPAAALAADLRALEASEIKGSEVNEACQEFADLVLARRVIHSGDPLLDSHISGASKLRSGDGWRFSRRGQGHVDAVYAAAGAVHVARTVPEKAVLPQPMIV